MCHLHRERVLNPSKQDQQKESPLNCVHSGRATALSKSAGMYIIALNKFKSSTGTNTYPHDFYQSRFSHDQSSAWIETIPKRTKKRPNTSISEGHSLNIFGLATERVMPSAKEIMQPTFLLGEYPVRREESNAAPELHKFHRIKLNCERSMGNASFTVVDNALFERLL